MYISYFNAIKTVIEAKLPAVKTFDYFNNQYNRYDDLKAVKLPAVYVEFQQPVFWQTKSNGWQTADTTIALHIVMLDIRDSPERNLLLANELHKIMQGLALMDGLKQLSTAMMRTQSSLKADYDQLKVIELVYATELQDDTAVAPKIEISISLGQELI